VAVKGTFIVTGLEITALHYTIVFVNEREAEHCIK
jgi:hypothetical protein